VEYVSSSQTVQPNCACDLRNSENFVCCVSLFFFVFCKFATDLLRFSEIEKCSVVVHIINFSTTAVDANLLQVGNSTPRSFCHFISVSWVFSFCQISFVVISNKAKYFNIVPALDPKVSHTHVVSQMLTSG
jgi:hypothetical protein